MARAVHGFCGLAAAIAALLSASCDAQAPPDYRGEPLFVGSGAMRNLYPSSPVPPFHLVLAWLPPNPPTGDQISPQELVEQPIEISSGIDGNFEFRIYAPPPDSALPAPTPGKTRTATALLRIVDPSNNLASAFGGSTNGALVYTDRAIPMGAPGWTDGGVTAPGFHVVQYDEGFRTQDEFESCMQQMRDSMHCGTLTAAPLCASVYSQSNARVNDDAVLTVVIYNQPPCDDYAGDGG